MLSPVDPVDHASSEYVPDRSACGYMAAGDRIKDRGAPITCKECHEVITLVAQARALRTRGEMDAD